MAIPAIADDVPTYWEGVAATKWGSYITGIEKCAILQAHSLAQKPAVALEIGCEGGRWTKLLSDLGWSMICTDIDREALLKCRTRVPAVKSILVGERVLEIPCATDGITLLLCMEVFPYIHDEMFVHESLRVLKSKGLVVGVFLNLLSFRGLFSHLAFALRGGKEYYRRSYLKWKRQFRNAGFSILHEEGFCWFPFRRASDSALVPVFTRLERFLGLNRIPALSPWIVFVAQKN